MSDNRTQGKAKYEKPKITVLEVESENLLAASGDNSENVSIIQGQGLVALIFAL